MELYRKVIIKSEDDYPKSDGEYFCCRNGFMSVQKLLANPAHKSYMREIRWYLLPIEQEPPKEVKTEEEVICTSDILACKHKGDETCNVCCYNAKNINSMPVDEKGNPNPNGYFIKNVDTLDLMQYVTNLLYAAANEGPTMGNPAFDNWVDEQIKNLESYYAQFQTEQRQVTGEQEEHRKLTMKCTSCRWFEVYQFGQGHCVWCIYNTASTEPNFVSKDHKDNYEPNPNTQQYEK